MKGIVFTEFFDLVAGKFGMDMVDDIIDACELPSGGSYTAVGTYDHREIVDLVGALSEKSQVPVPDLLNVYGEHLFGRFVVLYPQFFANGNSSANAFEFLAGVQNYIHVEVRKLYPTAELPTFDIERPSANTLVMIYHSGRHLEDVAEGLIQGCLKHFKEEARIDRCDDEASGGVKFTLTQT